NPTGNMIAEKFDMWLPHIAPVGEVLLAALEAKPGERILDLASGTGEPALTLARRLKGHATIIGIDAADGMVQVAQAKVMKEKLQGISFHCMPAEQLAYHDNSFDRILCRFGVMLFNDPLQGMREMRRALKPGGRFAIAVWSTPEAMPVMHWAYETFKTRLPEDLHPPLAKVTSLGAPGLLQDLLNEAGFAGFSVERRAFDYQFGSFEELWDTVEASDILKQQYDALPQNERGKIRDEVGRFARDFIHDGQLRIPHEYLVAAGNK
ncbi:MAG: class I SAM-dependent methyltransferase, partial [Gammaproteobacteria bacterium]|nr:class I SAM-dependent methyltransferase [Gammaproteobacteria bacterium]